MDFWNWDFRTWIDGTQLACNFVVIFGGLYALVSYRSDRKKERKQWKAEQEQQETERRQREDETYQSLDEKYVEFQQLCLQHPDLDVFDVPDRSSGPQSEEGRKRELIILTILISLFERAFVLYRDHAAELRQKQWAGWEEFIEQYCRRQNFRAAWKSSGTTFDADFQCFMEEKVARAEQSAAVNPSGS